MLKNKAAPTINSNCINERLTIPERGDHIRQEKKGKG